MTYREIRDTLLTGDLILFRGKGLVSLLILWFCSICKLKKTTYSHIGMIVVDSGRVMLFESTTLFGRKGVQLNPLSERLQVYKGSAYLRHLNCTRDDQFYKIINDTIVELLGRPYEKSIIELMGAASRVASLFAGRDTDLSSVFCQELISEIFIRLGFFPQSIPPNKYNPDDNVLGGRVDEILKFSDKEVWLSQAERIK